MCCNSWGCKESDTTERLNWTDTFRNSTNSGEHHQTTVQPLHAQASAQGHQLPSLPPHPSKGVCVSQIPICFGPNQYFQWALHLQTWLTLDTGHAQGLWEQDHTRREGVWSVEAICWMEGRQHQSKHDSRKPKHSWAPEGPWGPWGKDHPPTLGH